MILQTRYNVFLIQPKLVRPTEPFLSDDCSILVLVLILSIALAVIPFACISFPIFSNSVKDSITIAMNTFYRLQYINSSRFFPGPDKYYFIRMKPDPQRPMKFA